MIKKVTFENAGNGSSLGTFVFLIEIENTPLEENEINIIIDKMIKFPTAKSGIAIIVGEFPSEFDNSILTFIMALKDKNFIVQIEAPGDEILPWYNQANRLVVHVHDKRKWPTFPCDEFVLHVTGEEAPEEPQVPELNQNIILSLAPGKLSTVKVFAFLNKAKHNWRIYPEATKVYIQVVYKGK